MTPAQHKVLQIIQNYINENGYSPTLEEIGKENGTTKQNVSRLVQKLQDEGRIFVQRGKTRGITVTGLIHL
tara:strand:+ start:241 stop:453 length:213 start_codon:yes stop_codon:yes gene_type:complete